MLFHHEARDFSLESSSGEAGELRLVLGGRLTVHGLHRLHRQGRKLLKEHKPKRLTLDLGGVDYLDSAGALAINLLRSEAKSRGIESALEGLGSQEREMFKLLERDAGDGEPLRPPPRKLDLISAVGEGAQDTARDFRLVVSFLGELVLAMGQVAKKPRALPWPDVFLYMEKVGVDGLPIVGLIAFLLGLILAYMSALQLAPFGANLYVANLVGLAMVRELGPIMTAILIAGRSGSAFAAEIGTMKVNQEVDALTVMGFDPVVYLALPKIFAALLMLPLLTLMANLLGILGGLMVGVFSLQITIHTYINQTMSTLTVNDIWTGTWKSLVFAFLIAAIGCQRGFTVAGGAQDVGRATTSAVVAALFLIIVADSVFAILLYT